MPTPRRRHPVWFVGVAVVALLVAVMTPGVHLAPRSSPPTARAASAVGHAVAPAAARPANVRHLSALAPSPLHLDLTTTPTAELSLTHADGWLAVTDAPAHARHVTAVTPHGRAPPAL